MRISEHIFVEPYIPRDFDADWEIDESDDDQQTLSDCADDCILAIKEGG